ncbi:hypothetical protein [Halococcus sediminicola]|uniref:hypothetical protein n=1 Tax=Halococcus sediminicola TaxID=1264579 RepID=UPI0006786F0D|nr:hypothetical protein [Halococcus sediminicola]
MGEQASDYYVERYLYDLSSDPAETVNLVGRADYRSVAEDLREQLRERIIAAGEPNPEIHPFVDLATGSSDGETPRVTRCRS